MAEPEHGDEFELTEGTFGGSLSDVKAEIAEQIQYLLAEPPAREPFERIATLAERYKEAPELLDPILSDLLTPLVALLKKHMCEGDDVVLNDTCKVLYVLLKVRGYKTVIKFFPHEVSDLEPVEKVLRRELEQRDRGWETRYVLMIWLAIIVMIPFDLATVDSQLNPGEPTLVERVVSMCKQALLTPGCDQQAAAILIQRLLTRREVCPVLLSPFIEWVLMTVDAGVSTLDDAKVVGVLAALDGVFKTATRDELLPYSARVLAVATQVSGCATSTKRRLYGVKLAQRAALTFLPPRVAKWRYERGQRSLALNLAGQETEAAAEGAEEEDEEDDDIEEFAEEVAEAIDLLLGAVADKDTVCRWSAAKGIGRVAVRLPKDEADEVIGALLEMFSTHRTNDQFWHGACLALGELARRGVLLPERLAEVVPLVRDALAFDQRRGSHSVGAHVRDAACYVCWAFGRAYTPQVMKPHVVSLATSLVTLSLFDREVNCRRAASAAFQENVGRQGSFPHGIEIVTTADFFSLGNRTAAYTKIALYVAQFDEYREALLQHLLEVKVSHWDEGMRSLAATSLAQLSALDEPFTMEMVLPMLLKNATLQNLCARHGSLLALAALLTRWESSPPPQEHMAAILPACAAVVATVHKKKLIRGSGGEATRTACCEVVRALFSILSDDGRPVVARMIDNALKQTLLEHMLDAIDVGVEALHGPVAAAVSALLLDCSEDFQGHVDAVITGILEKKLADKSQHNTTQRAGYVLAIGGLPGAVYARRWHEPIQSMALLMTTLKGEKAPEVRRNAVNALHLLTVNSLARGTLTEENWKLVFGKIIVALGDYSKDNRGQVGSWVRTQSLLALRDLARKVSSSHPELWTAEMCHRLLCCTLRLALEHLDKVRLVALETLREFVVSSLPQLPHKEELSAVCSDVIVDGATLKCFELLVELTSVPSLCKPVVLGLCDSVGAPGKYTSEAAITALRGHLCTRPDTQLAVLTALVKLIGEKKAKVSLCGTIVKALYSMLCADVFDAVSGDEPVLLEAIDELVEVCKKHPTELPLLVAAMGSAASMLVMEADEDQEGALPALAARCIQVVVEVGLRHEFPRVRSTSADAFYNSIQVRDDLWEDDDTNDEIQSLLLETAWESDLDKLQPTLQKLQELTLG